MVYAIVEEGIPIGFFQERKDAENALKHCKSGMITKR